MLVFGLLLLAITACRTAGTAATTQYAVCHPAGPIDHIAPTGEGVFTAGRELLGTPVGLDVPLFTIDTISPEGVTFRDLGLVPEGALVVADTATDPKPAQFRIIALETDEDRARALIATYDAPTSPVACAPTTSTT
jgi:hypothetical protein